MQPITSSSICAKWTKVQKSQITPGPIAILRVPGQGLTLSCDLTVGYRQNSHLYNKNMHITT